MNESLAITENDYQGVHLKPEAKKRLISYIGDYFSENNKCDVNAIAKAMNVQHKTAKEYVRAYWEEIRVSMLDRDDFLTLVQKKFYDVLDELRKNPEKYGFKTNIDEKEKLRFEIEIIDRILTYKKMESPLGDLEDVKNASQIFGSMGDRVTELLLEKIRSKRKIVENENHG